MASRILQPMELLIGVLASNARQSILAEDLTAQEQEQPLRLLLGHLRAIAQPMPRATLVSRLLDCREELTWAEQLTR